MREPASFEIVPLGDGALIIRLGNTIHPAVQRRIRELLSDLVRRRIPGIVEIVPAYTTVAIYYDILEWSFCNLKHELCELISHREEAPDVDLRLVEIPVCYGGEFGPDLEFVAQYNSLTPDDVIEIHSSADYLVYMIGFAPGFPYLGGMSDRIATPRRDSPRLKIPAGSVGIAGRQTGVYPIETPGGWQLIGRTPIELFCPKVDPPTLVHAGDKIRFKPIPQHEFAEMRISSQ